MPGDFFKRKSFLLLMALCLLLNLLLPFSIGKAAAEIPDSLAASVLSDRAVTFLNKKFQSGEEIDGYTAYVLTLAGEQLGTGIWSKDGVSLNQQLAKMSDLVGNSNLPVTYILANQNQDGSFQPFPGAYGTRAMLQALARIKGEIPADTEIANRIQNAIGKSVAYFQTPYLQEKWAYSPSGDLDFRTVEALVDAGEDLSSSRWTVNGKTLKQAVLNSAAANAASKDTKLSDLAKELTAVTVVAPSEQALIKALTDAILAKKTESTDSLQFGENIYEDVVVLNALGKAGKLAQIDQTKALVFLNTCKHAHENSWGTAAGAAWGSYSPEEADLTAQVLQVLSFFEQTGDTGAAINQAIQDGFKYLQDVQNKDTGAIEHEYDSTYTTAETLIAIEANGDGYKTYNSSTSGWAFTSKTKSVAQLLLAAVKRNDTERINRLSQLLLDRHTVNSFENSVYSDMLAYIALGEAGKIDSIAQDSRAYILKKQSTQPETEGVWGETFDKFYPDFLSTTQAIRALTYLPGYENDAEIQTALTKAIQYLKSKQQEDGGIYNPSDDALVDTAEAVISLKKAGQNPDDWKNEQGKTPVNYVLQKAVNPDGSFGQFKNSFDAAETLYAYCLLGKASKKSFTDVSATDYGWAVDPIETLAGAGILNGIDGNLFEPARSISRAEFAATLTRIMGIQAEAGPTPAFSDVKAGQWYTDAVAEAAKKGWILGYEDGTFRPNNLIRREEMAVILVRANQWTASTQPLSFTDKATIDGWAADEVGTVAEKGLIKGFEDSTFRPKNSASRAEAAVMLYRMVGTR